MTFLEKLESKTRNLEEELRKTRAARADKDFHMRFVSQKINEFIRHDAKNNADNPTHTLGTALSKVSEFISDSFEHINSVETNIIVTINAYNSVKEDLIAYENQKKQEAASSDSDSTSKKSRKRRSVAERPEKGVLKRKKKTSKTKKEKT